MTTTTTPSGVAGTPAPADQVTFTIDDVEVSVPKGTLVIRAAEQMGIAIFRFFDYLLLMSIGVFWQC